MKNSLFSIIITSFLLISGCISGINSGEGKKIGQIVKIAKHRIFCSTYEAEIIRGGFNGGSGVNGAALNFTIKNKKLYQDLTDAMENQQEIELRYVRRALTGPCYSETGIIATGFKVIENKKEEEKTITKVEFSDETL